MHTLLHKQIRDLAAHRDPDSRLSGPIPMASTGGTGGGQLLRSFLDQTGDWRREADVEVLDGASRTWREISSAFSGMAGPLRDVV